MASKCIPIFTLILGLSEAINNREELLLKDPILWPGHLEPFGSQQPTGKVEERDSWPDPAQFFTDYVAKNKPLLLKGLAKQSPGYTKFTDDYFKDKPGSNEAMIYVEPELKENRTKQGETISMKEFIGRYHNETMYMVNALPSIYTPDVRMPAPVRCESTKELLSQQVTWFSTGGTKSVLHSDSFDNINCLFRGSKDLWFIEPVRNRKYVPIDRPNGYSSLDVDKVNYTRYPELRKVDMYYKAKMEQGDCLFIPFNWFHQVNSVADENRMNLAVNVWFKHDVTHVPTGCSVPESEATVDKYYFPDDEDREQGDSIQDIASLIPTKKYVTSRTFPRLILGIKLFNRQGLSIDPSHKPFVKLAEELFLVLEISKNGKLSAKDFKLIERLEEEKRKKVSDTVKEIFEDMLGMIEEEMEKQYTDFPSDEDNEDTPITDEDFPVTNEDTPTTNKGTPTTNDDVVDKSSPTEKAKVEL